MDVHMKPAKQWEDYPQNHKRVEIWNYPSVCEVLCFFPCICLPTMVFLSPGELGGYSWIIRFYCIVIGYLALAASWHRCFSEPVVYVYWCNNSETTQAYMKNSKKSYQNVACLIKFSVVKTDRQNGVLEWLEWGVICCKSLSSSWDSCDLNTNTP